MRSLSGRYQRLLSLLALLAAGFSCVLFAQPTSLKVPKQLDFYAPSYPITGHHNEFPVMLELYEHMKGRLENFLNLPNRREWIDKLLKLRLDSANWTVDQHLAVYGTLNSILLVNGDFEEASAIQKEMWSRMTVEGDWYPQYRWNFLHTQNQWQHIRGYPGITKALHASVGGWAGLGVLPGEMHTERSLIELEYVLFYLGGNENRMLLFDDLRPRILAAFPRGHPMRTLCEARYSFSLRKFGRYVDAMKILQAALADLTPERPFPNRRLEMPLYNELTLVALALGDTAYAEKMDRGIAEDYEAIFPPHDHAIGYAWNRRALVRQALGDFDGAVEAWRRAEKTDVMNSRMRIGILYMRTGREKEGRALIESSVEPDWSWRPWGWIGATTLIEHLIDQGELALADRWFAGAVKSLFGNSPVSIPEKAYFDLLRSKLAGARGDSKGRREHLTQALAGARTDGATQYLVRILFEWADLLAQEGNQEGAIAFGKNAAARLQAQRLQAAAGDPVEPAPVAMDFQPALERSVGRLVDSGRLPEAEQMLAVLQEERYFDFVRRASRYAARSTVSLTPFERQIYLDVSELTQAAAAHSGRVEAEWRSVPINATESPDEPTRVPSNTFATEEERLVEQAARLVARAAAVPSHALEDRRVKVEAAVERELPVGVAVLNIFPKAERYAALIRTQDRSLLVDIPVDKAALSRAVQRFRQAVASPVYDAKPYATALYRMAFARVFAELSRMRVREIQVAADGVLRYLPFAALHDGRGYLVERFAFIAKVDTPVQPTQPIASRLNANNGIAFFAASHTREARQGSTEAPLPNALPEVVRSSDVMRAAKVPSHVFKEFSSADFTKTMRSDLVPSVVHVASHFILNPASETESTLLTSDGALSLATMANWSWRGVKLAVFSACNTGLGGQSAGLHETLLRAGAENVVASLWMVNDSSAAQFMPAMYKSWTGKQDWQRAFAQTQRHFARGGAGKTLSHPHHWAAFVLYSAGA